MKKIIYSFLAAIALSVAGTASAQVNITKIDRIEPTDGVYMDMAVEAAKSSVAKGGKAGGAVVILNNAFHSSGNGAAPESAALAKARIKSLANAKIYTVNEPTAAAVVELATRGAQVVYFVNSSQDAIDAGIYTPEDYDYTKIPDGVVPPTLIKMEYEPATSLLK